MTIEEVEQGLGLLLSSGWTLDDCLALSWSQLAVCIRCVVRVKAEQARMVMETVAAAMGAKVKGKKNKSKAPSNDQTISKDERLMASIAAAGVHVHDVGTPSS